MITGSGLNDLILCNQVPGTNEELIENSALKLVCFCFSQIWFCNLWTISIFFYFKFCSKFITFINPRNKLLALLIFSIVHSFYVLIYVNLYELLFLLFPIFTFFGCILFLNLRWIDRSLIFQHSSLLTYAFTAMYFLQIQLYQHSTFWYIFIIIQSKYFYFPLQFLLWLTSYL